MPSALNMDILDIPQVKERGMLLIPPNPSPLATAVLNSCLILSVSILESTMRQVYILVHILPGVKIVYIKPGVWYFLGPLLWGGKMAQTPCS